MDNERRLLLAACAASLLPACASPDTGPPPIALLGIHSAGAGGSFLPYAQGLAAVLTRQGVPSRALESSGSIENVRKVDAQPQDLGTVFLGTAFEGVTGSAAWTQGRKHANVRALFPMYETSFQLVALRRSGIANVAALAGKRVGVGPAGGPAEAYFKGLASRLGLAAAAVTGTPAALAQDLLAGRIDALWQGASVPIPPIQQVADQADATVFGLSTAELAAMLQAFPFLSPAVVPAGTYRGQTAPLSSIAAWNFVVAHKDMPDAHAWWITRTVLGLPDPRVIASSAGPTRAANAPNNKVVPFHPGALRYYREQGITGLAG
jgi:TRAP transporter TAXI family solute receptor